MSKSMTSVTERCFRVTYHGTWSYLFLPGSCIRCTGSSVHHFRVLPLCPACQHPRRGNRSICICVSFTHVLYMNVEGTKFCDVDCVFDPISPYYGTHHSPRRPVNPSSPRHGKESQRAFVLSTWLIDARICDRRGLIYHVYAFLTFHTKDDKHHFTVITTSLIGDAFLIWRLRII
ncbi:hypothetical protein EDB89DRAFT_275638 [Lactarius sanguifluus]|nr:hypothetical protein EDB89DRAFT_275638 [Lactarius sanguifluus]